MGFKIWCQVEGGGTPIWKLPYVREFGNIYFQTCTSFFSFKSNSTVFLKISEYFLPWKIEKIWLQTCNLILLIVDSSFFFILKSATRGRKVPDALSIKKKWDARTQSTQREGATRPMRNEFSKLGDFVKIHVASEQHKARVRNARYNINLKIMDGGK